MILVFDDDKRFRNGFITALGKLNIGLGIIECSSKEEVRKHLANPDIIDSLKVIIFDLAESKEEAGSLEFAIVQDIQNIYNKYPIPIFIHSAFSEKVNIFESSGTVFKIKKGTRSVEEICLKIQLFSDSGFLNIFCPKGILESFLLVEVNKAFRLQFQGGEIPMILESIANSGTKSLRKRTTSVFKRIAVRALFQNMLNGLTDGPEKAEEVKVNAVEHYYRRNVGHPVWTGDIFRNLTKDYDVVILTPRCDITNNTCNDLFLACKVEKIDIKYLKELGNDLKKLRDSVTDNPLVSGYKFRYLIPTPTYRGGKIDFAQQILMKKDELTSEGRVFEYQISLSDELTNEVVRKFASYILRGGISTSEINEAAFYSKYLSESGS